MQLRTLLPDVEGWPRAGPVIRVERTLVDRRASALKSGGVHRQEWQTRRSCADEFLNGLMSPVEAVAERFAVLRVVRETRLATGI